MTIINRRQVRPFRDPDEAIIRELAGPSSGDLRGLSVAEIRVKAGRVTTAHHHRETEEVYHILRGHGLMCLDGTCQAVGPGDTVIIRPGVRHELRNTGRGDIVMIVVCAPPFSMADTLP